MPMASGKHMTMRSENIWNTTVLMKNPGITVMTKNDAAAYETHFICARSTPRARTKRKSKLPSAASNGKTNAKINQWDLQDSVYPETRSPESVNQEQQRSSVPTIQEPTRWRPGASGVRETT